MIYGPYTACSRRRQFLPFVSPTYYLSVPHVNFSPRLPRKVQLIIPPDPPGNCAPHPPGCRTAPSDSQCRQNAAVKRLRWSGASSQTGGRLSGWGRGGLPFPLMNPTPPGNGLLCGRTKKKRAKCQVSRATSGPGCAPIFIELTGSSEGYARIRI